VIGLTVGLVLSACSSIALVLYTAALAVYSAVLSLGSAAIAWSRRDLRALPWLPFVFLTIHLGAGAGILAELLSSIIPRSQGGWRGPTNPL
jgi:hypothetical protein